MIKKIKYLILSSLVFSVTGISYAGTHSTYDNEGRDRFPRSNNLYVFKLGGGFAQAGGKSSTVPFIAIGNRFDIDNAAIEISMGWGEHKTENGNTMRIHSLPKVTYLMFYNPTLRETIYYGGGLSWSAVRHRSNTNFFDNAYFRGIFAEGTIGYELNHGDAIRTMLELNFSQPMISNQKVGKHPGPTTILSLNFGF